MIFRGPNGMVGIDPFLCVSELAEKAQESPESKYSRHGLLLKFTPPSSDGYREMEPKEKVRKFLHDLSTPLASANLNVEMAIECMKGDPSADLNPVEFMKKVEKNLQKLQKMIEDYRAELKRAS